MSGVYGDFVAVFPELHETLSVWTLEDKSDMRKIRGVYMPTKGDGIKRRKYTSGNTGLDITETDALYVNKIYRDKVHVGDYVYRENETIMMRLTGTVAYDKAGDYLLFTIEKVTGSTADKNQELKVKEAYFA